MTTLPALSSVNDILDTDLVLIEHSTGEGFKMTGADLKAVMKAQAVDTVAANNMNSVTSNAVATALRNSVYHANLTSTGKIDGSNTIINWEIFCIDDDIAICFGTNTESKAISANGDVQFILPAGYHAYGSAHFYFYGNIFLDADPGNSTGAIHNITNGMLIYSTKAGNVSAGSARCLMIAQKDR